LTFISKSNFIIHLCRKFHPIPSYQKHLSYFEPFSGEIHVFVSGPFKSENVFFYEKIGQYRCQTIQNFMLISDLKEYFRKIHQKKVRHNKRFFWGVGFKNKKEKYRIIFSGEFSSMFLFCGSKISIKLWIFWYPY
jgi:hypothetical protein